MDMYTCCILFVHRKNWNCLKPLHVNKQRSHLYNKNVSLMGNLCSLIIPYYMSSINNLWKKGGKVWMRGRERRWKKIYPSMIKLLFRVVAPEEQCHLSILPSVCLPIYPFASPQANPKPPNHAMTLRLWPPGQGPQFSYPRPMALLSPD